MPTVKYQGRDNFKVVPEGEYILLIEGFEWEISKGQKTSGSDVLILECSIIDPKTGEVTGAKAWDRIIFAESTGWRIDVLLKALGKAPAVGDDINIDGPFCEKHIQNASAWASLTIEEYNGVKRNKIGAWLTNKGPVPAIPALAKKEEKGFE